MSDDMERGIGADSVPDWLRGLIRSVRREAIPAKDPRVKSLWDILRQRGLLGRSPWIKGVLLRCWQGLPGRERPRTTRRLVSSLRRLGILPPAQVRVMPQGPVLTRVDVRAAVPVRLTRVASTRPVRMRPVRPVRLQPAARLARR